MKFLTLTLCALVSLGLACSAHADDDDGNKGKYNGKSRKVEATYRGDRENKGHDKDGDRNGKKDKEYWRYNGNKGPVWKEVPHTPTRPPVSVPDGGSTAALLGLTLAALGLAQLKRALSLGERL
jgi:hypothetical protein